MKKPGWPLSLLMLARYLLSRCGFQDRKMSVRPLVTNSPKETASKPAVLNEQQGPFLCLAWPLGVLCPGRDFPHDGRVKPRCGTSIPE